MRIKFFYLLITITLLFTGCWSKKELSELAIVQAVGIDKTSNGNYQLSYQLLKPSEAKGPSVKNEQSQQGKGIWVLTSNGETIFEAVRNATFESSRKLYFPHNRILVISEEIAREGVRPIADFFTRDPETRRLVSVFISHGKAVDVINADHPQENIPASAIESLAEASFANSKIPKMNLNEILKNLSNKNSNFIVPGIETINNEELSDEEYRVKLKYTAIFKEDKLIDWFNGEETRGLLWVLGKVKSGIIVVPIENGNKTKKVSLEIVDASSEIIPELSDDNITIKVKINVNSNIGEVMSKLNVNTSETIKDLENKQNIIVKEEIEKAISKAQYELNVDVFGFGEVIHRKNPSKWKELKGNWQRIFSNIIVEIEIESKIQKKGMGSSN